MGWRRQRKKEERETNGREKGLTMNIVDDP